MLKRLFLILIICFSLIFLVYSRITPVTKLWRGYTVLYTSSTVSENTVLSVLSKCGISGVITLSEQDKTIPKTMSPARFAAENKNYMDYPEEIKKYFFDESQKFQLYYVPDGYRSELSDALETLLRLGSCGVDETVSYPIFVPVICALFFLCLLVSAENRLAFVLFAIFPLVFCVCAPGSINGVATCLLLYGCFLLQKLYSKQNAIFPGFHNVFLLLSFFSPILISFSVSLKNAGLCAATVAGTIASACMILHFKGKSSVRLPRNFRVGSSTFSPISIISAPYTSIVTQEVADCLFLCAGAILLQIVLALFPQQRISSSSGVTGLSLPSPSVSRNADFLPDLNDYLNWSWNLLTFQYRPLWLSEKDLDSANGFKEGDVIEVPFFKIEGTKVVQEEEKRFVYGEQFLNEMLQSIENAGQKRIELLLAEQGNNAKFAYAINSGGVDANAQPSLVILLCTVCIPLGMALYYIYRRRKQYANSI